MPVLLKAAFFCFSGFLECMDCFWKNHIVFLLPFLYSLAILDCIPILFNFSYVFTYCQRGGCSFHA